MPLNRRLAVGLCVGLSDFDCGYNKLDDEWRIVIFNWLLVVTRYDGMMA